MPELTDERRRRIASLKYDPAFIDLLSFLDEWLVVLTDAMYSASEPEAFIRAGRVWQVARTLVERLHTIPQDVGDAIQDELGYDDIENPLLIRSPQRPYINGYADPE
jgi:hypothetical protein